MVNLSRTRRQKARHAEKIRKLTLQLLQDVKEEANEYGGLFIYKISPYGSLHPQEVLRFPGVRTILHRGIQDDSGTKWILLNFDGGARPYVMKFRPVLSFKQYVITSLRRIKHPLASPARTR